MQIDLQRFSRLIAISNDAVEPKSPPLSSLVEALQLFLDAFKPAGGFRLLRIARPPILFYGLYGNNGEVKADQRLLQLLIRRGLLASQLDCLMRCDCSEATVRRQIALDKVLYDIDRAIDLYAVGNDELGAPEQRAASYSYMVDAIAGHADDLAIGDVDDEIKPTILSVRALLRPITGSNELLFWDTSPDAFVKRRNNGKLFALMHNELCNQYHAESNWQQLIATMGPDCISSDSIFGENGLLRQLSRIAINIMKGRSVKVPVKCPSFFPTIPANYEDSKDAQAYLDEDDDDGADTSDV